MKSKVDSVYLRHERERLCQGDIFRDIEYIFDIKETGESIEFDTRKLPYIIVLTQDCDLESDHRNHTSTPSNQDKFLQSILVSPAYLAEQLKDGIHLSDLSLTMQKLNTGLWKPVKSNQNARYHFLPANTNFQIPELVVDFKHYYTIPKERLVNNTNYIGTLNELFRENLSHRFAHYLSRIGLPELNGEVVNE
jgi:hypothetical protein